LQAGNRRTARRSQSIWLLESHVLRTDHGDPLVEDKNDKDPAGDDSFIFETDGNTITKILWVNTD